MGIETKEAIINDRSYDLNFTNEGGIEGTTRFLKNICGMWLYERCRKEWPEEVRKLSHPELQGSAMQVEAFRSIINPDDKAFANPSSMIEAIQTYCRETGQAVPETPAEICRCIFDSLALRYRQVFGWLKEFWNSTAEPSSTISVLHVIGGGSLNKYLTQFTADACNVEVLAGPQECTAIGNIMLQAKASGDVADIWQMRQIIANSVDMVAYHPTNDKAAWDAAYEKYLEITK
jgi:rhamnulokinase